MIQLKGNQISNEHVAMFEAGAGVIVVLRKMIGLRTSSGEALRSIPQNNQIKK